MKRLIIALVAVFSCAFAVSPDYFSTNVGAKNGKFVKSVAPAYGLIQVVNSSKPTDSAVVTGTFVLYTTVSATACSLNYITKNASGNITSGNIK